MTFSRMLTNLCSDKLAESRDFYVSLLGFEVSYDSDWYVQLRSPNSEIELGIIDRRNELVPPRFKAPQQACMSRLSCRTLMLSTSRQNLSV